MPLINLHANRPVRMDNIDNRMCRVNVGNSIELVDIGGFV